MAQQIEVGLVQIHDSIGRIVGVGFLVSDTIVLTCAHVINSIIAEPHDQSTIQPKIIHLSFTLIDPQNILSSEVVSIDQVADIACLKITDNLPINAMPLRLIDSDELWNHGFRTFGFPSQIEGGVWVQGNLLGGTGQGWIQIEEKKVTSYKIQRGFSGGPVWDEQLKGVVGMIVAADSSSSVRAAFCIPSKLLITAYPDLQKEVRLPCPYLGLTSFREQDESLFFGRETYIEKLKTAVLHKPFVGVIGPSGCGKSSVVFAGLIPHLRKIREWEIIHIRPNDNPLREISAAILSIINPQINDVDHIKKINQLTLDLTSGEIRLTDIVDQYLKNWQKKHLLLIVDQFEEIYTITKDSDIRNRFIKEILDSSQTRKSSRLTVLLTIRADFLPQILLHRPLVDALQNNSINLGPMSSEELKRAIVNPAKKHKVDFEVGLPELIIGQMDKQPGTLSLLEFSLTQLWDREENRQLTLSNFLALGGINQALSNYAESVYGDLTPKEQETTRNIFTQLVLPGAQTDDISRITLRSELADGTWELVRQLADLRLVVTDKNQTGQETVEIAHETLVRNWPRLQNWVEKDQAFRSWQEELRDALYKWGEKDRDEKRFLQGLQLEEASNWLSLRRSDLGAREEKFILASQKAESRKKQKSRIEISIFILFLFVLIFFSLDQSQKANEQSRIALSRQLSTQSISSLSVNNTDLAFLLSIESARAKDTLAARSALLSGLAFNPRLISSISAHKFAVREIAFSPNKNILASSSCKSVDKGLCNNGEFVLWDYSDLNHITQIGQPIVGHTSYISSIAFNPKGNILASGSIDKTIILWDITNPTIPIEMSAPLTGHTGYVKSIVFSSNRNIMASGGEDQKIILWDISNPNSPYQIDQPYSVYPGELSGIAFSKNGELFASGTKTGVITLWNISDSITLSPLSKIGNTSKAQLSTFSFTPNSKILASGYLDGTVILWELSNPEIPTQISSLFDSAQTSVSSISFSPEENQMAVSTQDGKIILWDITNPQKPFVASAPFSKNSISIYSIAFSPDGKIIASGNRDGEIFFWNAATKTKPTQIGYPITGQTSDINVVEFSHDGKILASGSSDKSIILWNTSDPNRYVQFGPPITGSTFEVFTLVFSPDDKTLISGGCHKKDMEGVCISGEINLWNISNLNRINQIGSSLVDHSSDIFSIAISPNGKILASSSKDRTITLWDISNLGNPKRFNNVLNKHNNAVYSVAFSPNGKLLVSGGGDSTIRLWDISNPESTFQIGSPLVFPKGNVRSLAISPNGKTIASSGGNVIVLWDITNPENPVRLGYPLLGHRAKIRSLAFNPTNDILASGDADSTIILWDVLNLSAVEQIGPLITSNDSHVLSIAFSPDGTTLASSDDNESIMIWKTDINDWIARACGRVNRNFSLSEWENFFSNTSYRPSCPNLPIPIEAQASLNTEHQLLKNNIRNYCILIVIISLIIIGLSMWNQYKWKKFIDF